MINDVKAQGYIEANRAALIDLLAQLARIPAPSHQEERRAAFCRSWLEAHGAEGVYLDSAKNVVYPYRCDPGKPIVVFMAHMDVVFPDLEPFTVKVDKERDRMYAPGIGDDTANLANLLFAARYVAEQKLESPYGLLFVANACEEGLGGLKGCKEIIRHYKSAIRYFYSFDGYLSQITNDAVGSHRYEVTINTEGGHSYFKFGSQNAIAVIASLINTLYTVQVPKKAKTTYNVGTIEGGTTINSIAQQARIKYEYRSLDAQCLHQMQEMFHSVIEAYRSMGVSVSVRTVDQRPCKGELDEIQFAEFTRRNREIIEQYYRGPLTIAAASTDANIPLSEGICANTIGTVLGDGAHTYGEWIEISSMYTGLQVAMAIVLSYGQ